MYDTSLGFLAPRPSDPGGNVINIISRFADAMTIFHLWIVVQTAEAIRALTSAFDSARVTITKCHFVI
jgi:hypothetical protein